MAIGGHEVHVADVLGERGHDVTVEGAFRGSEAVCHLAAIGDVYLAGEKRSRRRRT